MLISFIVTTWLLAMLPGVGQALMLRQTLAHGPHVAAATIAGTATGLMIWAVVAGVGLSAALLADPTLYRVLIGIGGGFLVFVGLRTVWGALGDQPASRPVEDAPRDSRMAAFLIGLATNLGNPKAGVFAITLLPAFAGAGAGQFLPTIGLGLLWSVVTASWYLLFVWLVSCGRHLLVGSGAQKILSCTSGAVLVTVGGAVAFGL